MREEPTAGQPHPRRPSTPGWPTCALRDLIAVTKDGEWGKADPAEGLVEVAVVRGTDFDAVVNGRISSLPTRHVQSRHAILKTLCKNDLVIETAGGSRDRPTGRTLFIHDRVLAGAARPLLCASFCRFIRAHPDAVEPGYLYWYLQRLYAAGLMTSFHTQHTGLARFQWTDFAAATHVPLPPRVIQSRIAALLFAFDEMIQINERRIELLEELARSLYREWFVRFRFPGHEDVELEDSELGSIPDGWSVCALRECATVVMGQSPKSEFYNELADGLPFHQGVTGFGSLVPTHAKYCTVGNRVAEESDVLCSVRAPVGRLNIADRRMVIGRGLSAVRRRDGAQAFLMLQLRQGVGEVDAIGGGTIYKAINKDQLGGLQILEPPKELVELFERIARPILSLRLNLTLLNRQLTATRDLLMPRVVAGRLDIPDVDFGTYPEVE